MAKAYKLVVVVVIVMVVFEQSPLDRMLVESERSGESLWMAAELTRSSWRDSGKAGQAQLGCPGSDFIFPAP